MQLRYQKPTFHIWFSFTSHSLHRQGVRIGLVDDVVWLHNAKATHRLGECSDRKGPGSWPAASGSQRKTVQ